MATGTAGSAARKTHMQVMHTMAFDVNYNDPGIASGVNTGKVLPAGAVISGVDVYVNTVFNAQTTNVLTVGTNGTTANDLVGSSDVNEASAQMFANITTGGALGKLSADKPVYVKYTQTGTAATTGAATVVIKYVPNVN